MVRCILSHSFPFTDLGEFRRNYVIPINNGTAMDSSPAERLHGRRKLWALRKLLDKLVLRVDVDDKTYGGGVV